jgi:hypothetical protein
MEDKYIPDKYNNKITNFLHHSMRALVTIAFIVFIFQQDWSSAFYVAFIFMLMLTPSILKNRYKIFLPFELEVAIVAFIFLSVFLGDFNSFYERFPLWDGALHFQSGLLLGVLGFVMIYILNQNQKARLNLNPGFISFFAVNFSVFFGVIWEIFEFIMDSGFGFTMQESGLADTMGDLIVNLIGALIVAVMGYFWMKRRNRLPFTPQLLGDDNEI